jgi:transcriptional regulator with XRE-family HTH domain
MMLDPSPCVAADTAGAPPALDSDRSFGSYVRRLRRAAGILSGDMARRLGISGAHYASVELGSKAPLALDAWGPFIAIGAEEAVLRGLVDQYRAERAGRTTGRPSRAERETFPPGHPRSSSWEDLTWEDDDWCWYAVAHQPDGLSQEEVALLTGWSAARVRAVEESSLRKLRENPLAREHFESLLFLHQHCDEMRHVTLSTAFAK